MSKSTWIFRHADRLDLERRDWYHTTKYNYDTPLSVTGIHTATNMGHVVWRNEKDRLMDLDDLSSVIIYSSPFKRCLQTAHIIASTVEQHWSKEKGIDLKKHIHIRIEHGLGEDIPCKHFDFVYNDLPILGDKLHHNIEPCMPSDIEYRLDHSYEPVYKPDERPTFSNHDEYNKKIETVMNKLLDDDNHTVLISSHRAETHDAYTHVTKQSIEMNRAYGVMTNLVRKDKGENWEVNLELSDWHSKL
jgi:phosphohistidine phosphatase SixA